MGPKRFYSQNFSLFIVKFKKLGFSALLIFYFIFIVDIFWKPFTSCNAWKWYDLSK